MEPIGTRESLLDAAEKLFSEQGIQAASLRAITAAAGANLAAVHYHFGSKQALVRAVISRRVAPIQAERLRRLAAARSGGEGIEGVVRAFIEPLLQMVAERPDGACLFARTLSQTFGADGEELRSILIEEFAETIERFSAELARLLPELTPEEVLWRFHFMAGALVHSVAGSELLERVSQGRCHLRDVEAASRQMVRFLAAGFRAPGQGADAAPAPARAARRRRQAS